MELSEKTERILGKVAHSAFFFALGMAIGSFFVCLSEAKAAKAPDARYLYFMEQPCLIPTKGHMFKTCEPIFFQFEDETFIIPSGFETDLASIPKIFWNIYSPNDAQTIRPSIIHDFMYRYAVVETVTKEDDDRDIVDLIFYENLRNMGCGAFKSNVFYYGVRIFGRSSYQARPLPDKYIL